MIGYFKEAPEERGVMSLKDTQKEQRAWIDRCERDFSDRLRAVATALATEEVKLLRLSGPTCSGKTTLATLLCRHFEERGKRLHLISIDDFYYDKDTLYAKMNTRETGRVDYDSAQTIDLAELARFTKAIFTTERAECPIFDFIEGRRVGARAVESRENDVFLFEGIQALYPEVTEIVSTYGVTTDLYIAPMRTIKSGGACFAPNELRLLRRLVRDSRFRGTCAEQTLSLWSGVRQNEEEHIFPYVSDCRYRIDSAMDYEIGVLKPILEEILPTVAAQSPYRPQAEAILAQLIGTEPIDRRWIPEDSLYREFV